MNAPSRYTPPEMTERLARHAQSKPAGMIEYSIRQHYQDLCHVYGAGMARDIVNQIIDTTEARFK
jgi:molybdopterin-guanine dinucleotide biosynthesis protein A